MKSTIENFMGQSSFALVGASRGGKKFGNYVLTSLKRKGYQVYPINPHAGTIDGELCYSSLSTLPVHVDGVIIVVPPNQTERVVREAAAKGIDRVWIQQGAESEDAISFCVTNRMSVVHGECILMFAKPVDSFHRLHRWFCGILGKLPK